MKPWTCAVFLALLAIAAAQTCPSPWFDAHFVALADAVITTRALDTNLTYFQEVLRFTEQEIEPLLIFPNPSQMLKENAFIKMQPSLQCDFYLLFQCHQTDGY